MSFHDHEPEEYNKRFGVKERQKEAKEKQSAEHQQQTNIPDGENDWWVGSDTFTRQQVLKILYTQRAMISNDIKRSGVFDKLPEVVVSILENPRTPNI